MDTNPTARSGCGRGPLLYPVKCQNGAFSNTLAKYIDHWLAEVAPKKLAKTTYSRDQQDVRRILPALGHFKLTDLRKEVIRDFYEEMRKAPKLTDGKPLSEKSVEGIHNTLCSILSDAVEEGYLLHNPAWKMYKPQGEKKAKRRSGRWRTRNWCSV